MTMPDAAHRPSSHKYDELGNRITQTDANGHITHFAYGQLGRRSSRTLPMGMSESYSYDVSGNLSARTDFNGHTTTYAYDNMNRLLSKKADAFFSTGACAGGTCGATQVSYTYNNHGKRKTMTDASGVTTYDYDGRDGLAAKSTPVGNVSWTYDLAGNQIGQNGDGLSVRYAYDALNRLHTVDTSFAETVTYNYDDVGNLAGNQVGGLFSTGYTYDPLNRLTNMQSACGTGAPGCGAANTAVRSYAYTLGAAGNRLSVADLSGRTVQYGYDDLYRLTSENIVCGTGTPACALGAVSYSYDSVGNRMQLNSTLPAVPASGLLNYDANDRTSTDVFDANGNTTFNGQQSIYDFENRLVARGGVSIVYDGDGEWGLQLIAQRDLSDGTFIGHISYYGLDGHGSVRFLTNPNGAVSDTYDYDAFGNLISQTGTTVNNYLFAGEQFDSALGIYYNRARYYDQRQGRFWTTDTREGLLLAPKSLNKYLYAGADPTNHRDPSGYESASETIATTGIKAEQEALQAELDSLYLQVGRSIITRQFLGYSIYVGATLGLGIAVLLPGPDSSASDEVKTVTENINKAKNKSGCKNVVYHYTNFTGALGIYFSSVMTVTQEYPGLPSGAYATDIAPWENYTQEELVKMLYFSRTNTSRTTYCVILCNDQNPGFEPLVDQPHQRVLRAPESDYIVEVNPIAVVNNPMRKK